MQGARGEPSRRRGQGRPPARRRLCSVSFLRLGFPFSLCVCSCLSRGTGKAEPSLQPPQLRGQPRAPHPRPYSVSLCWEGAAEPLLDPVPLTGLQPCGSFGRRATRSHPSFPVCVSVTASSGRGEGGVGRSGLCPNTGLGVSTGLVSFPLPGAPALGAGCAGPAGCSQGEHHQAAPCCPETATRWVPAEPPLPS